MQNGLPYVGLNLLTKVLRL